MNPDDILEVWIRDQHAGTLTRHPGGDIDFEYDSDYARHPSTPPLSLSMPKTRARHTGNTAGRWIGNLLPDSEIRRNRIGAQYGVRRATPFNLLRHIGHDTAGAVQILPTGTDPDSDEGHEHWSDRQIADELGRLRDDPDAVVTDRFGRWSLAGQQGKIALTRLDGKWYEPTGRAASTHILKVGIKELDDSDIAEFATMRAARLLDIPTATVELATFEGVDSVIVERFDRIVHDGRVDRVHQEDMCQAADLPAELKYQSDGGPGIDAISALLRDESNIRDADDNVRGFAQLALFNTLAFAPDAHAKNYSVLHLGYRPVLAPAYDLISGALLHDPKDAEHNTALAMKFGTKDYRARAVEARHVARAAEAMGVDPDWLDAEAARIAADLSGAMQAALDDAAEALGADRVEHMRAGADWVGARAVKHFGDLAADVVGDLGSGVAAASPDDTGPIAVAPHMRGGRPVAGHLRRRR